MALALYQYDEQTNTMVAVSSGTQVNPISSSHNGIDGETVVQKFFLRNGDNTKWYDAITVIPVSTPDDMVSAGNSFGWSVKVLAGDTEPTAADWSYQTSGASVVSTGSMASAAPRRHYIPEIGAVGSPDLNYYPLWLQVIVPAGQRNTTETGISIRVTSTENAV